MNINNYKILISNLPVRQQCFTTKRTTWSKAESEFKWLKNLNNKLFGDNKTLTISRQEIFETNDTREIIIKTIYWGYTAGMRGNHFIKILKYIETIEKALRTLKEKSNLTTNDFNDLILTFKNIEGLGLSTYSKLLYFFKVKFNDNPCLILDQRLINVFASKTYKNFQQFDNIRYDNAEKKYLDFLQLAKQLAIDLETHGENIELFLFSFGNNLKEQK
jgi:seryl-tRNA synthetase